MQMDILAAVLNILQGWTAGQFLHLTGFPLRYTPEGEKRNWV